jgi:hypothetical protein
MFERSDFGWKMLVVTRFALWLLVVLAVVVITSTTTVVVMSQPTSLDYCNSEILGAWVFCLQSNGLYSSQKSAECVDCMELMAAGFGASYPRNYRDCSTAPRVTCLIIDECKEICSGGASLTCLDPFAASTICNTGADACTFAGCVDGKPMESSSTPAPTPAKMFSSPGLESGADGAFHLLGSTTRLIFVLLMNCALWLALAN